MVLYVVLGVFLFGGILFFILPTASGEETEETFTTVPDLAGMSEIEAVTLLFDVGLAASQHSFESHETINSDMVIRSEPNAGEFIEQGAQVNLIYSIAAADLANVDAVRWDVAQIAVSAQGYYMKPKMLGGGGRSFEDISFYRFAFPADGINDHGTVAQNENGRYVISGVKHGEFTLTAHPSSRQVYVPGDLEIIPFFGLGDEDYELTSLGTDGANPLQAKILPDELKWVDAGTGTDDIGT